MSLKRKHGDRKDGGRKDSGRKEEDAALAESVRKWEANVAASHENLNDIVEIYNVAKGDHVEPAFAAIGALGRIYAGLWAKDLLKRHKGQPSTAAAKVAEWLRDNYNLYIELLRAMLRHKDAPMQVAALRALMQMLEKEGQAGCRAAGGYAFPNESYLEVIVAVLDNDVASENLLRTLNDSYVSSYDDLRMYFF
ncbi:Maturation and nuclear export of 40S ribosomal subunits interacting protein, partial [Coemansia spiralis]